MKLFPKSVISFYFLLCSISSVAHAQGCYNVDKYKLANAMSIARELVPLLNLEIPSCENIYITDGYAGFILNEQNTKLHNGIRSELSIDFPFNEGDTVEYRWSLNIPSRYAPGGDASQWWLIAQWHDQPDPRLGETWATLKAQSPPVALHVEQRNGIVGIGLSGIQGRKISWVPVPTDVWLNIKVVIHWSTTNSGIVSLSVDGHPEFDYIVYGRNMLNSFQHYFKAGQYRSPTVNKYSVVYLKNIQFRKL